MNPLAKGCGVIKEREAQEGEISRGLVAAVLCMVLESWYEFRTVRYASKDRRTVQILHTVSFSVLIARGSRNYPARSSSLQNLAMHP
eukprot:2694001-Rhodomonas_salina.1